MNFEFKPIRKNVPDDELESDVKAVATKLKKSSLTIKEYDEHGQFNSSTIIRRFKTWNNVLNICELTAANRINIEDEELHKNILTLWEHLGRQPRRAELESEISRFSQSPYNRRFKTWSNALMNFVKWANNEELSIEESNLATNLKSRTTGRDPSLRLRFKVLKRDNFTCVQCGASPAKELGIELHLDHVKPWSKGGETTIDNLQTLCVGCNLGKSNIE